MHPSTDPIGPFAPVNLRGHHFLCALTYIGRGYTHEFERNFEARAEHINRGAAIRIVSGVDDICAALHKEGQITCSHAKVCKGNLINRNDRAALKSVSYVLQMPILKPGETVFLGKGEIRYLREKFAQKTIRRACTDCPWFDTCSEIAARNFAGVKLMPSAVPNPSRQRQHAYGQSS